MTLGTSFGNAAADYDKGRPTYPLDAVRWLVPDEASAVADIGAGTGKLTAVLAALGHAVIAVDPDPAMLATLSAALPTADVREGSAEALPLEDGSVDAVVFGQAWHWVDPVQASLEAARVLKPGGTLGLVWNIRDDRTPWVARLTAVMRGSKAEDLIAQGGPRVAAPFAGLETRVDHWSSPRTADAIRSMVRSRSYYITGTDEYRSQVDTDLEELIGDLGLVNGETIEMPYVTYSYRVQLR